MKRALVFAAVVAAIGCGDASTVVSPTLPSPKNTNLGLVEIKITGIGTPNMSATVSPPTDPLSPNARGTLTPVSESGKNGIQVRRLSSGTFTFGTRGQAGSYRYIFVTFEVRNASTDGTAYTTERKNLTFIPVSTSATISGTPVKSILKFDGSAASTSDAENWIPTGAAYLTVPGDISALSADVLQAFTESEVAAITMPSGVSPFPYGFMVRHATATSTRTLAANPSSTTFDGYVTFAYKVPLPVSQSDDPYTVVIMAMAVDDTEVRVTQSVEERDATSKAAFESKASALSATGVTLLTGGSYSGSITTRTLCGVRSAGTASSPIQYVNGPC